MMSLEVSSQDAYRALLQTISDQLSTANVAAISTSAHEVEEAITGLEALKKLENEGLLSSENVDPLADVISTHCHGEVAERCGHCIEEYKQKYCYSDLLLQSQGTCLQRLYV